MHFCPLASKKDGIEIIYVECSRACSWFVDGRCAILVMAEKALIDARNKRTQS